MTLDCAQCVCWFCYLLFARHGHGCHGGFGATDFSDFPFQKQSQRDHLLWLWQQSTRSNTMQRRQRSREWQGWAPYYASTSLISCKTSQKLRKNRNNFKHIIQIKYFSYLNNRSFKIIWHLNWLSNYQNVRPGIASDTGPETTNKKMQEINKTNIFWLHNEYKSDKKIWTVLQYL